MRTLLERLQSINENHKFYPEDWTNCKNADDVVDAILDALSWSGVYDSLAESVSKSLDPHIFTDKDFLEKLGDNISEAVNEVYEEEFD